MLPALPCYVHVGKCAFHPCANDGWSPTKGSTMWLKWSFPDVFGASFGPWLHGEKGPLTGKKAAHE